MNTKNMITTRTLLLPLVLLLAAAAKAGAEPLEIETVPPIQIMASTRTFRDVEKEQRLWWQRVMVAPALARLEKRGNAPWAADARKLLADAPDIVFAEPWQDKPTALQPIARSVVNGGCDDPAILILDEATSSLDAESERAVHAAAACASWARNTAGDVEITDPESSSE